MHSSTPVLGNSTSSYLPFAVWYTWIQRSASQSFRLCCHRRRAISKCHQKIKDYLRLHQWWVGDLFFVQSHSQINCFLFICLVCPGMLLGSYFWGCLADTKGRKVVLIATLLLDGVCGLLSSVAQYYWIFMFFRFFNGFGYVVCVLPLAIRSVNWFCWHIFRVAGAMGICFPYLGEFQPTKYREKILCWMEMFWTIGIIILPGMRRREEK